MHAKFRWHHKALKAGLQGLHIRNAWQMGYHGAKIDNINSIHRFKMFRPWLQQVPTWDLPSIGRSPTQVTAALRMDADAENENDMEL